MISKISKFEQYKDTYVICLSKVIGSLQSLETIEIEY